QVRDRLRGTVVHPADLEVDVLDVLVRPREGDVVRVVDAVAVEVDHPRVFPGVGQAVAVGIGARTSRDAGGEAAHVTSARAAFVRIGLGLNRAAGDVDVLAGAGDADVVGAAGSIVAGDPAAPAVRNGRQIGLAAVGGVEVAVGESRTADDRLSHRE